MSVTVLVVCVQFMPGSDSGETGGLFLLLGSSTLGLWSLTTLAQEVRWLHGVMTCPEVFEEAMQK